MVFTHSRCFWRMKQNKDKEEVLVTGCIFFLTTVQWPVEKDYFNLILNTHLPMHPRSFIQLIYAAVNSILSDHGQFPSLYQKAHKDASLTLKYFSFNASLEWLMVQTFDMVSSESSYVVYSAVYAVVYAVS
ncbi:hypothetical protein U0070_025621 [Myodes glareolus]|uniref:Uncharacterized protein n=1 Tax=Myodes glareolus TaxID=447135 RepID=A0AAW0I4U2_MYOGA